MNNAAQTALNEATFDRARRSRDPRFDGRFFVAVITTGIYCRPICPARSPRSENVRYYTTAAGAAQAGYRPCLRCRPECAPGSAAWNGTSAVVSRALRLIEQGVLDQHDVPHLAGRLGVTSRHLGRLFSRHVGASPLTVARTARLQMAKRLMDDTDFGLAEIAIMAGYQSVRSFNHAFQSAYGHAPSQIRRRVSPAGAGLTLRIPVTTPYPWQQTLSYLDGRAIPGVEQVADNTYRRTIEVDGQVGLLEVVMAASGDHLLARLSSGLPTPLASVSARIREMFDAEASVGDITSVMADDQHLGHIFSMVPGLRVPGAWDGFELTVRAILGQQVSVVGANTTAGKIARRFGKPLKDQGHEVDTPTLQFPTATTLASVASRDLPIPRKRGEAVIATARAVVDEGLNLSRDGDIDDACAHLLSLPGIGPWTCAYVRMRVMRDPDAFPEADLGLRKGLADSSGAPASAARALELAQRWRPWRSYAAMALWQAPH